MPTSSPRSDSKRSAARADPAPRALERELAADLARRGEAGLLRRLDRPAGTPGGALDLTTNDALGLSRHTDVVAAARAELERSGAGGRASRLLGGGSGAHARAERACAAWLGAEAALLFPSGYQANLGLVGALVGRGDCVLSDERNHASLVDAARLSRARVEVFAHGDLADLERRLVAAAGARRRLVVVEGVYSMTGALAPLAGIHALCERHDAWLVVDEAHAAGIVGPEGAGAWAACAAAGEVPGELAATRLAARVVTGGKALGCAGAFAVGSRVLRDHLLNVARAFVYTTAAPPATAAALAAAIGVCRDAEDARARLRENAARLAEALDVPRPPAAILTVETDGPRAALEAEADLRERGFEVRAVRPPTAPRSLLRVVVRADLGDGPLAALGEALSRRVGPRPAGASAARPPGRRTLFVVGTDTGIGKTVVSALLLAAGGPDAVYWKPVQTGPDDDTAEVARLAGRRRAELPSPAYHFPLPASPHEAAAAAGARIDPERLRARLAGLRAEAGERPLVVELAGGLHVPLVDAWTQADWLAEERPELVLVARSGLGTLNHTQLTLDALRARHLEPRALLLVGVPHRSNHDTLKFLRNPARVVEVPILAPLAPPAVEAFLERVDLGSLLPA